MTKPQSPLTALERPRCRRCQARMPLVSTEPTKDGGHQRTFRCAKCDEILTVKIAADPMKSSSAGWLAGELKPPT
jgi:tRNA(Ile2) C34 agmatinyltransferase TiaS